MLIVLIACSALPVVPGYAQGVFLFFNASAPTRIGSLDGSLAGTGIWAQMLAGPTFSSLLPVGMALEHATNGLVGGVVRVAVPTVPAREVAQVQMVAWDGTLWGTSLAGVPTDQLGRTDVVPVFLTTGVFPDVTFSPSFNQPAIVPPIPEPSTLALCVIGWGLWVIARGRKVL
jgi:hypothetical protein